ncbi:MAG TPA: L,D-transpeptidase family protein [Anaerolineales bacterium]
MTTPLQEAQSAIQRARLALSHGDQRLARQWAERAAKIAPHLEDPWLVLAAVAGPRQGMEFIQKALQINPESARARSGMEWVMARLRDPNRELAETGKGMAGGPGSTQKSSTSVGRIAPATQRKRAPLLIPLLVLLTGCLILAIAGVAAMSSPFIATLMAKPALAYEPTQVPQQWAQASIPKPTYTASIGGGDTWPLPTPTVDIDPTPTAVESDASMDMPTPIPTEVSAETEIPTAEPTWSGTLSMDYVADTPTPEFQPTAVQPPPGDVSGGTHWIDVNLSQQMVYAYAGDTIVNSFLVSTGTYLTPTVTGKYKIWVKLRYSDMSGADYYLPNVPFIMYFYKDYGLHGTYWHSNFGTPMSHGCVNLSIPDAEWLYNFSSVGTVVNVHY